MSVAEASPLPPSTVVAIVGAGAMGAGIAQVAAFAGHPVRLFDVRAGAAAQAVAGIAETLNRLARKGRIEPAQAAAAAARLSVAGDLEAMRDAGLVIEAIIEDLQAKRDLLGQIEAQVGEECILATNTSSISVTAIGAPLRRPQRLAGMHFFNPAPVMALVEIVSGMATAPEVAATLHATAAAWGKAPVHAKSTPGFIVNRVARPFYAEALRLLQEGAADCATIDAVLREAGGFRIGPFELMDLIGHDVNYAVTRSVFEAFYGDPRYTPSLLQLELVNAGRLGRKSGQGFYDYASETRPGPVAEAARPLESPALLYGDSALVRALDARLRAAGHAARIHVVTQAADDRIARVGDAIVYPVDGRSATRRAAESGLPNTVLVDLALDCGTATRLAMTCADRCTDAAWHAAVALIQAAGFAVSRFDDVPGLAVTRTVVMLANEAADAVNQGVCTPAAVDLAMCKGVNYPRGPLAWADELGADTVVRVLQHLAESYGEDRYRVSPLLRRWAESGRPFHVST